MPEYRPLSAAANFFSRSFILSLSLSRSFYAPSSIPRAHTLFFSPDYMGSRANARLFTLSSYGFRKSIVHKSVWRERQGDLCIGKKSQPLLWFLRVRSIIPPHPSSIIPHAAILSLDISRVYYFGESHLMLAHKQPNKVCTSFPGNGAIWFILLYCVGIYT